MSEFKIGDRVRIVRSHSLASHIDAGKEGKVVARSPLLTDAKHAGSYEVISVLLDGGPRGTVWTPTELEHIE